MESLIVNVPIAAAMYAITIKFLEFFERQRSADRLLWENHLSRTVVVLEKLVDKVTAVDEKVEDLDGKVDKLRPRN